MICLTEPSFPVTETLRFASLNSTFVPDLWCVQTTFFLAFVGLKNTCVFTQSTLHLFHKILQGALHKESLGHGGSLLNGVSRTFEFRVSGTSNGGAHMYMSSPAGSRKAIWRRLPINLGPWNQPFWSHPGRQLSPTVLPDRSQSAEVEARNFREIFDALEALEDSILIFELVDVQRFYRPSFDLRQWRIADTVVEDHPNGIGLVINLVSQTGFPTVGLREVFGFSF
mmetsp:Transcript_16511/g.27300  ORF Transcript_16511/g.27300 Transcript_16511/m.27300 type:complete len:226 (-) Transcript_16511:680-1357(-)